MPGTQLGKPYAGHEDEGLLQDINKAGVAKLSRILAVLQPFLAALGAEGGLFRPDAAHHLEKARNYCAHLTYSPATLINAAISRPDKFSTQEWMALLEVWSPPLC